MTPTSQWVFQRVKVVTQNWLQTKKQEALNYQASHFINECGRWDLNPHGIATTRSLVLLVCQFRHFRLTYATNDILPSYMVLVKKFCKKISLFLKTLEQSNSWW